MASNYRPCNNKYFIGYLDYSISTLGILVMYKHLKIFIFIGAGSLSVDAFANGMIDFNPYVGMGVTFDNNIFRYATDQQAQAAGINRLSDRLKKLEVGATANLNLSRQKFSLNTSFVDNTYERYDFLDNVSKNIGLNWNWTLGSKLFGVIGKTRNEASVGFTEARVIQRVIRTTDTHTAGVNWMITPDFVAFATKDYTEVEHDKSIFINNNREDDAHTIGLRYSTPLGNQISASWREVESDFNDRTTQNSLLFGDTSTQKTRNLSVRWYLTHMLKMTGSVSGVDLTRPGSLNGNFSGNNNRFGLDYAVTDTLSFGASMYKELTPIDDVAANYIQVKGFGLNASWDVTSKIKIQSSYLRDQYDYLGNSGLLTNAFNANRKDDVNTWNVGLLYSPLQSTAIQFQYTDSNRDSSVVTQGYDYQSFNMNIRYYFQ